MRWISHPRESTMRDLRRMAEYDNRRAALERVTSKPGSPGAPATTSH